MAGLKKSLGHSIRTLSLLKFAEAFLEVLHVKNTPSGLNLSALNKINKYPSILLKIMATIRYRLGFIKVSSETLGPDITRR